jgi:hypothetical protein
VVVGVGAVVAIVSVVGMVAWTEQLVDTWDKENETRLGKKS